MSRRQPQRATLSPAALDQQLDRISAMSVENLRSLWRDRHGHEAPVALSKDLLARALAHDLQKTHLGDLIAPVRKLIGTFGKPGARSSRWLKVGSVLVREHAGELHEVMVTPQGFCWRGETFSSLSTIALRITGTSWNGARFFGLQGDVKPAVSAGGMAR